MSAKLRAKRPKIKLSKPNFKSVKLWTFAMLIAGLGMLGYSSYIWYSQYFTDNDRIFYGMLDKSLSTASLSKVISQNQGAREESQTFLLRFNPVPIIYSRSNVKQIDQNRQESTVVTETIGEREADFVRYTDIKVPDNPDDTTNYSAVIDQWAKRSSSDEQVNAQFLDEAIFSFIPFGDFNKDQRAELIQLLKDEDVYRLRDGKVKYENGRPIFTASLQIKPSGLVAALKKYNQLTGVGDESLLNPADYDDFHTIGVQVKIDVLSRHLLEISYPGDARVETYEGYGVNRSVKSPDDSISIDELQNRLQQQ